MWFLVEGCLRYRQLEVHHLSEHKTREARTCNTCPPLAQVSSFSSFTSPNRHCTSIPQTWIHVSQVKCSQLQGWDHVNTTLIFITWSLCLSALQKTLSRKVTWLTNEIIAGRALGKVKAMGWSVHLFLWSGREWSSWSPSHSRHPTCGWCTATTGKSVRPPVNKQTHKHFFV